MLGSFHTCCPLYIFKTGYLTEFGVHPAHPKDLSASTFPVPVLDISHYAFRVCVYVFYGCWRSEFSSSCFRGKHSTD